MGNAAEAGTLGNDARVYAVGLDSNGVLAVNVPWVDTNTTYGLASSSNNGLMSSTDKQKLDSISSVVSTITGGIGITASTSNNNTTVKTKLKTETYATIASKNASISGTQLYSVIADKDGYLAVSVPWTDNNTTYTLATVNTSGLMSAADKQKLDSLYEADGTGTVKSITAGVGLLTNTANNIISQSGTIKAKLKSETFSSHDAITATDNQNRIYAVTPDKNGYLSVVVPWTDTNDNTEYADVTTTTHGLMTAADKVKLDSISANASVSSIATGVGLTGGTITDSGTIKVKLKNETALSVDSTTTGSPAAEKLYPVAADLSGNLAVYVPWVNTTYNNATTLTAGLLSTDDKAKLDSIATGAQTGTVTNIDTGVGLTGGSITTTGTIKVDLVSEIKLSNVASAATETPGRVYPVALDKNGKLAVNVPWVNDNTTYLTMSASELKTGTATDSKLLTAANVKSAMTDGIFTTGTTDGTFKVYDTEVAIAGLGDLAYIDKNASTTQFLRGDGTWAAPEDTQYSAGAGLKLTGNEFSINTAGVTNAMLAGSIANEKLSNSTISIAGNTVSLGGSLDASTLTSSLGLSSALKFIGMTSTTMTDDYSNTVTVNGTVINPNIGDVVIDSNTDYEYVYVGTRWERLGSDSSYKLVQTAVNDPSANGTSTSFINTISQNAQGVITATKANLPTASTSTAGIIQITSSNADAFLSQLFTSTDAITDTTSFVRKDSGTGKVYSQSTAPLIADYVKTKIGISNEGDTFLRKDGTWATPQDTTYTAATQSAAGLMSAADKIKLDGIAAGAQVGTVTSVATGAGLVGGTITNTGTVKVKIVNETPLADDATVPFYSTDRVYPVALDKSGNLSVVVPWTDTQPTGYSLATHSANGLMSSTDKIKLDGIADGAQPGTVTSITGGVGLSGGTITNSGTLDLKLKSSTALTTTAGTSTDTANRTYPLALDADGKLAVNVPWSNTTYSDATQSAAGLMSANDKKKLDGITTYSVTGEKGIVATTTDGATVVKAKLKSETALTNAAIGSDNTENRTYAVALDSNGDLAVTVPWVNDNTTYAALTNTLINTGTDTSNRTVSAKVFKDALINYAIEVNALQFKGSIGTNGDVTSLPATHNAGWLYRVTTAGTYAGKTCEVGDLILCIQDGTLSDNTHWTVIQTNINGAVTGPASATDGSIAAFDGTTGKIIKSVTPTTATVIKTASLSGGAAPTLGTAFSIPNVTGNSNVTASKVTKSDVTVVTNVTQAASTSSVIATVEDGVLTIGKAITAVGTVSKSTGTANTVSISDVTASKVTLGTAFSVPNVTGVGSVPTLSTTTQTVVTGFQAAS